MSIVNTLSLESNRQIVYCKIKLPKVAKQKWTLLQVQIGQSCKGCI